jgi:hypothetical protein
MAKKTHTNRTTITFEERLKRAYVLLCVYRFVAVSEQTEHVRLTFSHGISFHFDSAGVLRH